MPRQPACHLIPRDLAQSALLHLPKAAAPLGACAQARRRLPRPARARPGSAPRGTARRPGRSPGWRPSAGWSRYGSGGLVALPRRARGEAEAGSLRWGLASSASAGQRCGARRGVGKVRQLFILGSCGAHCCTQGGARGWGTFEGLCIRKAVANLHPALCAAETGQPPACPGHTRHALYSSIHRNMPCWAVSHLGCPNPSHRASLSSICPARIPGSGTGCPQKSAQMLRLNTWVLLLRWRAGGHEPGEGCRRPRPADWRWRHHHQHPRQRE
jgi:hypothetical protein